MRDQAMLFPATVDEYVALSDSVVGTLLNSRVSALLRLCRECMAATACLAVRRTTHFPEPGPRSFGRGQLATAVLASQIRQCCENVATVLLSAAQPPPEVILPALTVGHSRDRTAIRAKPEDPIAAPPICRCIDKILPYACNL